MLSTRAKTLALLAAGLTTAGCLNAGEPLSGGVLTPGVEEPTSRFHLRLFDTNGSLLYSSWPSEQGALQRDEAPAALREPFELTPASPIPAILSPLAPLWSAAPANTTVTVDNLVLGEATTTEITVPRIMRIATRGALDAAKTQEIFGNITEPTPRLFAGTVLANVTPGPANGSEYRLLIDQETRVPVERTLGLWLRITPAAAADNVTLALELDGQAFETLGCRAIPGHTFDPGYYVLRAADDDTFTFTRYAERAEFGLQRQTVRAELTIISQSE